MTRRTNLLADNVGAAAVELALSVPVLLTMIYGIFTIGLMFEANAGMQQALGEGARLATLCPSVTSSGTCVSPADSTIVTRMQNTVFGMNIGTFNTPTVTTPTSGCTSCRDLTVSYTVTPSFLFFNGPAITLTRSKRVFLAT